GSDLYVGGTFTSAGGLPANNVAKWNGTTWSALGSGVFGFANEEVLAMLADGTNLYVGGALTNAGGVPANNIAKWDGAHWSALGSGLGAPNSAQGVAALVQSNGLLYAGGAFDLTGAAAGASVAAWDGANWSQVGANLQPGGAVFGLFLVGASLYATGGFTNQVAKWDGSLWSAVGSGFT